MRFRQLSYYYHIGIEGVLKLCCKPRLCHVRRNQGQAFDSAIPTVSAMRARMGPLTSEEGLFTICHLIFIICSLTNGRVGSGRVMMKHENIISELERIVAEADRIAATKADEVEMEEDPRLVALMERAMQIIEELDPLVRETLRIYPDKLADWNRICEAHPVDEEEE